MKKVLALYTTPDDPDAFIARYREGHIPLVQKIPGLVSAEITQIDQTMVGQKGNYLLAEMCFADEASFNAALQSPEMAAASADVDEFAPGIVTIMAGTKWNI